MNVMERDEGGGGQRHEFWRDVIIECSLIRDTLMFVAVHTNQLIWSIYQHRTYQG